jgi:outer membrane receptor protein involved in Fe transport
MTSTTVSLAALACALASAAWAQETAQAPGAAAISDQAPAKKKAAFPSSLEEKKAAVSEVVVTGTNIKGVQPIDPVITITRQDIDESGYATVGDVMRSLPEDFGGGQNPGVLGGTPGFDNSNVTGGSTVNLFGLGSDATLTLLNGHRMSSDGYYEAPDISVIPLGAIQRVEVVTDGSSAIYGSEAVAGVANFILRKDYNGVETSAYYGAATDGGDETQIYSTLAGISRDRWHVLVSAEYQNENPILASERDFTSSGYGPTTLIYGQTTKTMFVSGGVDITDKIKFSLDGLYSDRESQSVGGDTAVYQVNTQINSPHGNVAATLDFKLPGDWDLSLVGTEAISSNDENYKYTGLIQASGDINYHNRVTSVELNANGKVVTLPTGDLRMAFGGGYRQEGFKQDFPGYPADQNETIDASRRVAYAYGEALLPVVRPSPDRLGLEQLELSASGRYEHYSDFGDTVNPKVGLRYVPLDGFALRGTYGTSFKAPSFVQEYQLSEAIYQPIADCGGEGSANCLLTYGGNPKLQPERSKNWTLGAEYRPPTIQSLSISVNYFHIQYTDRIVQPLLPNYFYALSNPDNAPFATRNPPAGLINSTISESDEFVNEDGAPYNASTVTAIAQDIYQNAVSQVDSGVDISYRQRFTFGIGDIRTFANATWNRMTERVTAAAPVQTLSGTLYNIPNFRARAGASWSKYGLTATAIVNFTSSETNTAVTPNQSIASLTTVDVNLAYKFQDIAGIRHGLALALSATNLFDRPPPYVNTDVTGFSYDSLNASAVGRFIAFKVTKKW